MSPSLTSLIEHRTSANHFLGADEVPILLISVGRAAPENRAHKVRGLQSAVLHFA